MLTDNIDSLYSKILKWNFFTDFVNNDLTLTSIENDEYYNQNLENIIINNKNLKKIPYNFLSTEDYINAFSDLFILECKAQISKCKYSELSESEKFILKYVEQKNNFFNFEFHKIEDKNIIYTSNDLILIHKLSLSKENDKINKHILGIIDKYSKNIIYSKIQLDNDIKFNKEFKKEVKKDSEFFITKICNLATIIREFSALMSIDELKLKDIILNPLDDNDDDYFYIPEKLDQVLKDYYNSSQYDAIKKSIKKKGLTLIQGPPGTGKSTTILGILSVILNSSFFSENINYNYKINDNLKKINNEEYNKLYEYYNHPWIYNNNYYYDNFDNLNFDAKEIYHFTDFPTDNIKHLIKPDLSSITQPSKILVCAPSNVAIDEIVRKLAKIGLFDKNGNNYFPKFLRIGPNYNPNLKEYSLDYLLNSNNQKNNNISDENLKNDLLINAKIICSTLSMAGSNILLSSNIKFDTVVIDEASQAIELSTLIPLKYNCERLILVGDPNQLAATVFSGIALKYNYDMSLFERFQKNNHKILILKNQYRMKSEISNFISELFYNNLLVNDESIYKMNKEIFEYHPAFKPMTFYNIDSEEKFIDGSYINEGQIFVIVELIKILKNIYKDEIKNLYNQVTILSPYSKQVNEIKKIINFIINDNKEVDNEKNFIEVNTVDGFQGKEKNIIIFSTVRNNEKTIGFLRDERRINVGLTRAKNCLIVIGDGKTLIKDNNWDKLIRYSFRKGTFYNIKGNIENYFKNFKDNYKKYLINNEEDFIKIIFKKLRSEYMDIEEEKK